MSYLAYCEHQSTRSRDIGAMPNNWKVQRSIICCTRSTGC